MKTYSFLLLLLIITINSCKKDSNDPENAPQIAITYPDSIVYGNNILSFDDSTILADGVDYEIGTILEKNASLFLIITNYPVIDTTSGFSTYWFYANAEGWTVSDYDNVTNTQRFTSAQTAKNTGLIQFAAYGQTGFCKIDFYENGNTITRTKHFFWH